MRLLNVVLTAAIMMFALVGAVALGVTAAGAQEESPQQTFECPGAEVVDVIGPTDNDLLIGPFRITGGKFRLTYETTGPDSSGQPFFDVTVLDEAGNEVGGRVIFEAGIERELVGASPGSFTIEARAEDLNYKITIEDCKGKENQGPAGPPADGSPGGGSPGDGQQPAERAPIPADQYKSDVNDKGSVIDNTKSEKPLPETGGMPLLGLAVFGLVCVGAGIALLRPDIRRDS